MNALLEIGCEEIPARFIPGFLEELKAKAEEKLRQQRLAFGKITTLGTPRRLVLYLENLAPKQTDLTEEVKGPPAEAAFDASGKPTPAAVGFAKAQKTSPQKLFVRTVGNKNYVFAKITKKGQPSEKVLVKLFPEIITALYQPLAMRWGDLDFKFIRPIHWILALCGNKVVKFKLAGIDSSNFTFGHRYVKNSKVKVKSADLTLFKKTLSRLGVILDQNERKELVRKKVQEAAKKAKCLPLIEEDLLNEVNYLIENPIAYTGKFRKEFLELPQEVLITSMKKNQKYFPLLDKSGKLQAKFVVITDGCNNPRVVEGNEKVLSARLADARFFYEEDKKLPLKLRIPDLEKIAFLEKLGNLYHKVERIGKLSEWIGNRVGLNEKELAAVRRIAELCKADLPTKMVFEFPQLQGVMGKEYALLSGEDPKVAQGIFEHYLPRSATDKIPESQEGVVVALADRFDSIVGAFSAGYIPTGSEDPYGIRRAVHGVMRIILEKKMDLLLDEVLSHAYKLYEPVFLGYLFSKGETGYQNFPKIKKEILEFFATRLKPIILEKGIRHDVADAALADFNDLLDAVEKAQALNHLVDQPWFKGIVFSADRVSRLAQNATREQVLEHDLSEKEEKDLYHLYLKVNWEVGEKIKHENWKEATEALSQLTEPIDTFFNKVLVMHEDERLKTNRLALLKSLEKLYLMVADFRKIIIEGEKK
ncbi:MAG: glycine--tRNA ligase subunit beta [Candidatus Margulisiibacteriota bacterium]